MEFWGVEVKSGESFVVKQEDDVILHLSQGCLGEVKKDKGSEPVHLFAKVGDKKFVIGILSSEKFPQISFDLVFEKEFELSHNWKNGSVHFTGYTTVIPNEYSDYDSEEDDDIEPIPVENDRSSVQAKLEAKNEDLNKDVKCDQKGKVKSEEESSDNDFESEDEDESDEDESDDEETGESEDEGEENKVDVGQKRPAESAKKTPGGYKKAKFQTPEKAVGKTSGNKIGGHTATPHPAKQAGKTAAKNEQQTPKSGGAFPCKSCNRSFGSDNALQSHTKAKHAIAK